MVVSRGVRSDENGSCDKDRQQGDGCNHGHWIDALPVADKYVPYHADRACDKQCPHSNVFFPGIHGTILEPWDSHREEQGIDDTGEVELDGWVPISWQIRIAESCTGQIEMIVSMIATMVESTRGTREK
jgi:hypothetical protein